MKYTFLLFALSMLTHYVQAQTTKLVLNPKELSMQTGETNTVSVQVENADFDYQLFLSVAQSDLGSSAAINFRTNPLNPPYVTTIDISIQGAPSPGRHRLVIKAANGPLVLNDTCYITIPEKDCEWEQFNLNKPGIRFGHKITVDSKNTLWLASVNSFVSRSANNVLTEYNPKLGTNYIFHQILVDQNDNIWLNPEKLDETSLGLLYYDHNQFVHYTSSNSQLPNTRINAMVCDWNNILWLATDMGIVKFDGTFWTQYTSSNTILSSNIITSITIDKHNTIWAVCQKNEPEQESEIVSFSNQIWKKHTKSNFCFPIPNVYNSNFIVHEIAIDSSDNIWLSMASNPYSIVSAGKDHVSIYGNSDFLRSTPNHIRFLKNSCTIDYEENMDIEFYYGRTIKAASSDEIWAGGSINDDTHIYHYKDGKWKTYSHLNSNLPNSEISDLAIGSYNSIFVTSVTSYRLNEGPYLSILNCEEPIVTSYPGDARSAGSDAQISLYPNPVQNELFIHLQNLDLSSESIRVIDVHGNAIPAAISTQQGAFYKIDVADLVSGIYHITFLSKGKIVSQRFVKN